MISLVRTIACGYRIMAARLAWLLLGLATLALLSGAITLPVWLLASRAPQLFTALVLAALAVLAARSLHKRFSRAAHRGSGRWITILLFAFAGLLVVLGLAIPLAALTLSGLLAISLVTAWRYGR